MEAQRATDNIRQRASDCLGTEKEKPYTLAQRMIDQNEMFKNVRSKLLDVLAERLARKYTKFESGGIVTKTLGEYSLKERFFDNNSPFIPRCLINHAPPIFVGNLNDPLLWEKMEKWKKENNIA